MCDTSLSQVGEWLLASGEQHLWVLGGRIKGLQGGNVGGCSEPAVA